jgi:hypothetical protein
MRRIAASSGEVTGSSTLSDWVRSRSHSFGAFAALLVLLAQTFSSFAASTLACAMCPATDRVAELPPQPATDSSDVTSRFQFLDGNQMRAKDSTLPGVTDPMPPAASVLDDATSASFRPVSGHGTLLLTSSGVDDSLPSKETTGARTEPPRAAIPYTMSEPRFSFAIRGGFSLPENDLKLTTGTFPNFSVGVYGQFRLGGAQHLRPVGEWWSFSPGVQSSQQPSRTQTINTRVRAVVMGGEYLYQLGGPIKRLSLGGGVYLARWSVDSVNSVTLIPMGTMRASGTSQWIRLGEGGQATFRLSRRLDLEGRWVHSSYGYQHLPVNVVLLGAGWRF